MAREHPQSGGGCHSTSLNACNGVVGETPRHQDSDSPDVRIMADESPGDELELSNSAPDVGNDICSCIEQVRLKNLTTLWDQMLRPR